MYISPVLYHNISVDYNLYFLFYVAVSQLYMQRTYADIIGQCTIRLYNWLGITFKNQLLFYHVPEISFLFII